MSRPYNDLWEVDHTHTSPTDCVGNPAVVPEQAVEEFFANRVEIVVRAENELVGHIEEGDDTKVFVAKKILEDDDTLDTSARLEWRPSHLRYTQTVQPNWEKIPAVVREDPTSMNALDRLQGKVMTGEAVTEFMTTLGVINCRVTDEGTVSGYDLESQSEYIFIPIEDTRVNAA